MSSISFHALSVGGGVLALSPIPGKGGDYAGDMDQVAAWRPSIVISTTTEDVMARFGAENLGADLSARAARWAHFPIGDMGVPSIEDAEDWPSIAIAALSALRGGGRVLVHCKGGCGRSGMVALRLMVEAGEPVDEALGRLRAVRPCAVQSDPQYDWAAKGTKRLLPQPGGLCS